MKVEDLIKGESYRVIKTSAVVKYLGIELSSFDYVFEWADGRRYGLTKYQVHSRVRDIVNIQNK